MRVRRSESMATNGEKDMQVAFGVRVRAAKLSNQQFDVLIDFMRKHPTLALGRAACGSYSKEEHDFLWKSLTALLNSAEGPAKSISKWQKCWVDLKSNARSRAAKVRASSVDGTIPPGTTFTQWDEQVLTLLGEINPQEPVIAPSDPQKSPSQLVEVPLTSGKVVLMEMNGSRCRPGRSNHAKSISLYQGNNYCGRKNIKVEEPDVIEDHEDNYNLVDEVNEEEEDCAEFDPIMEEDIGYIPRNQDDTRDESEFLICPIESSDGVVNSLSEGLPPRRDTTPLRNSTEDLFQKDRCKKRKHSSSSFSNEVEESLERFSKRVCSALERVATAAEESNALQRGLVSALDRLSTSLEKLLPAVVKDALKNSGSSSFHQSS